MSIAKPEELMDTNLANVRILKARFAKGGQSFKDSILDNDEMKIILNDDKYGNRYANAIPKFSDEKRIELDNKLIEIRLLEDMKNFTPSIYAVVNDAIIPDDQISSETIGDVKFSKYQEIETNEEIIIPVNVINELNIIENNNLLEILEEPVLDNVNNDIIIEFNNLEGVE